MALAFWGLVDIVNGKIYAIVQGGYLSGLLALPASAGVALAIYSVL